MKLDRSFCNQVMFVAIAQLLFLFISFLYSFWFSYPSLRKKTFPFNYLYQNDTEEDIKSSYDLVDHEKSTTLEISPEEYYTVSSNSSSPVNRERTMSGDQRYDKLKNIPKLDKIYKYSSALWALKSNQIYETSTYEMTGVNKQYGIQTEMIDTPKKLRSKQYGRVRSISWTGETEKNSHTVLKTDRTSSHYNKYRNKGGDGKDDYSDDDALSDESSVCTSVHVPHVLAMWADETDPEGGPAATRTLHTTLHTTD